MPYEKIRHIQLDSMSNEIPNTLQSVLSSDIVHTDISNIPELAERLKIHNPKFQDPARQSFLPINPSIAFDEQTGLFLINLRYVNSDTDGRKYTSFYIDGTYVSRNFLILAKFDGYKLCLIDFKEIIVPQNIRPENRFRRGFEDIRLFFHKEQVYGLAVTLEFDPHEQQYLLGFDRSDVFYLGKKEIEVKYLQHLISPEKRVCEKNWLPFIKDEKLYAIYESNPVTILEIPVCLKPFVTEDVVPNVVVKNENNFLNFRGSAGPILVNGLYVYVVHELLSFSPRKYVNRFVAMNDGYNIVGISDSFKIMGEDIEFPCGMILHGDKVIMTFGVNEREGHIVSFDVNAMMRSFCF